MSTIIVTLIAGHKLSVKDLKVSDPYCKLSISNRDEYAQSKTIKNTINPTWNEEFVFDKVNLSKDELIIDIMDWDLLSKDDPMGTVRIPLNLIDDPIVKQYEARKYKVENGDGHLELSITQDKFNTTPPSSMKKKKTVSMKDVLSIEEAQKMSLDANTVFDVTTSSLRGSWWFATVLPDGECTMLHSSPINRISDIVERANIDTNKYGVYLYTQVEDVKPFWEEVSLIKTLEDYKINTNGAVSLNDNTWNGKLKVLHIREKKKMSKYIK